MTSIQRPLTTISDIIADLRTSVLMVHGKIVMDEIPEGVYHIAAECISGEDDQFAAGVKALLVNIAGAVSDGDLQIGDDNG